MICSMSVTERAVALKCFQSEPCIPNFGTVKCQFWGLKGHTDGLPKLGSPTKPFRNSMSEYIPSPAGCLSDLTHYQRDAGRIREGEGIKPSYRAAQHSDSSEKSSPLTMISEVTDITYMHTST